MRRLRITALALVLLAAALQPPAAAQSAAPAPPAQPAGLLRITELLPVPNATAGQREFIEVANLGNASLDLTGWRLRDAPTAANNTNEFAFPAATLAPGERLVVWSNGTGGAPGLAWSSSASKAVWNDGGDAASLLDPAGQLRDWLGYGSTTQAAPPGAGKLPAPPRGSSLQLDAHGNWTTAPPTPGLAAGQQGGTASVQVINAAPTVTLQAPAAAHAGRALSVRVAVADPNGAADVASWSLADDRGVLARGNGSHDAAVAVTAPARGGPWTLVLAATDAGGLRSNASATVDVQQPRIAVALPPSGALRFPALRPGERDVASLDTFTVRNDGGLPATPVLDVSTFRAGAASIPVDGNLWVGVTRAGATEWIAYRGPLEPLPELAPGEAAAISLRIGAVPVPAAAGLYGTTFTVVAA